MRFRHGFLVLFAASIAYGLLTAHNVFFPQGIPEYQIMGSIAIAITSLLVWCLLELGQKVVNALGLQCRKCSYSLHGVNCPECGASAGPKQ